jgi:hypothetical protein
LLVIFDEIVILGLLLAKSQRHPNSTRHDPNSAGSRFSPDFSSVSFLIIASGDISATTNTDE